MAKFIVVHSVKVATDFVPQTFGRLTTLGPRFRLPVGRKGARHMHQVCRCECGNIDVFSLWDLKRAKVSSCGCLRKEVAKASFTTHGYAKTSIHDIWQSMKARCLNPGYAGYHNYGGRGIRVCGRWLGENGFINFLSDMGERPSKDLSIDRYPNQNGNYEPGNCRWATRKEQARNLRTNRMLTYNGKTQCVAEWAEELGIPQGTLHSRLKSGWSVEKALSTPPKKRK
jgi:hypothetical protein